MKRLLLSFILAGIFSTTVLWGQYSNRQVGFRTGIRSGIFYQISSEAGNAEIGYNALLSFNYNGLQLTGIRIIYGTELSEITPDLYLAWGYGGHLGYADLYRERYMSDYYNYPQRQFTPLIGADAWGSIEYRFRTIPLNISLNMKPYIELAIPAFVRVMPADLGLSVSYVF